MKWVEVLDACARAISPGTCRFRVLRTAAFVIFFLLVVPLLLGSVSGVPPATVLALIGSTLLFQAAAAVVGLSLGLHPLIVLAFLTSVAAAILLGILEVCDLFAERSRFVQSILQKIDGKTREIDALRHYGALMLLPVIWIPGIALYGTPVVAWVFHYPRVISLLCMLVGWMIATVVVMAATMGLINLVF